MNRDQYIQMRRTGQYDLGWFYQYFLEHKDKKRETPPFEIFQQFFNAFFQMNGAVVLEFLDKKMEVTKIQDQAGQLIYIN